MVGNDSQQPQQQQVRRNPDGTTDQARLQAPIPSPLSSAGSHARDSTTRLGNTSAQGQAQHQPPRFAPRNLAPRPTPATESSNPTVNAQSASGERYPSAAELQDLGRRYFAFGCAMGSYRDNPGQWRVAPIDEHYLGPHQRRWLRQMATNPNPSPAQEERYTLLRNVVYQLERTLQPGAPYFRPHPAGSAQAPQTTQARQASYAPRAPQQFSAAQAHQVSHIPQAHRPSAREMVWDTPRPSAATLPSMPVSKTVAGPPVPIFPQPLRQQDLSTTPHARTGVPVAYQTALNPSGMMYAPPHSANSGMYRTIQSAPAVNGPVPQAQHVLHQPVPRPIPDPSAILHSVHGSSYPPSHPGYWSDTGSLLRPGGDPRFMELSWMDPGRRRPNEGSATTTATTATRSASQQLPNVGHRTTSPSSAQPELPKVAAALRRSTTERRAVGSEESDRSPQAKRPRTGSGPEVDNGGRKEPDKDEL